jgi:hypothetical protein
MKRQFLKDFTSIRGKAKEGEVNHSRGVRTNSDVNFGVKRVQQGFVDDDDDDDSDNKNNTVKSPFNVEQFKGFSLLLSISNEPIVTFPLNTISFSLVFKATDQKIKLKWEFHNVYMKHVKTVSAVWNLLHQA